MPKLSSQWLALIAGALLLAGPARADDSQLLNLLVKKGVLSTAEADQVQAEAAAAQKAVVTSTSKTIITGKLFVDFTTIDAETANGTKVNPSGVGLDVKRFYFGATHEFNSVWSMNILTDSSYSSATGATNLFIKTAYLQAKLSPAAIIQAGSAGMPWIPFLEDSYGFRYVENTLIDRLKFGNSADWGLHFLGKQGIVSYNFAAVNGGGYKNPTRSKDVDFAGRVSVEPLKGLTLGLGAYTGKLGKNLNGAPAKRTATRYDVMALYTNKLFRVGGEYFWESDWGYTASPLSDSSDGYSFWADAPIAGPYSVFARYDNAKLSKKLNPNMEDEYFNAGLQYHVFKGLDLALVYKHDHVKSPASTSQVSKYDEFGVFSQVAF